MESFHWADYYKTGIESVDEQHYKLVEIINNFSNLLSKDTIVYHDIETLFNELVDYTVYHFEDEERCMIDADIDNHHFKEHRQEHQHFVDEVNSLYSHISTQNLEGSRHLLEYLINWLAFHILGMDQVMAEQMREIKSGKTPQNAYKSNLLQRDKTTEALLSALNVLFKQVSLRNKELQSLNLSLEEKVKERTKELYEANKDLELLSLTDALTSLPNRRHSMILLEKYFNDSKENKRAFSCIMIDADHFKEVNDTHGHDAGDDVLIILSKILVDTFRDHHKVCRLGGDEFLVICPNTPLDDAMKIAEITRVKVNDLDLDIWDSSISVGVASLDNHIDDYEDLIKAADEALYISKKDGRNCVRTKA